MGFAVAQPAAMAPGSPLLPPIVYEREPGAAWAPPPASYRRREPEKTVLHRVVREHLSTFLDEARLADPSGSGYPAFVQKEFERFLDCGLLSRGFYRLRCPSCHYEQLLAHSCKGRICPSCWARRAADTAADLVDRVLPEAPYRQFVLTFPWPIRLPLAYDAELLPRMMRAYLQTLFSWMRRRGRALGIRDGRIGSVTFIQRFGSALNLNPHLHSLLPDGLFVPAAEPDRPLVFMPLPPPTDAEIEQLTEKIAERLKKVAVAAGVGSDEAIEPEGEQLLLAQSMAEAVASPLSPSFFDAMPRSPVRKPLCANVEGFCIHAARIVAAHDREGLERLCSYGLRPPFSQKRLSLLPDGRVRYQLRKPWPTSEGVEALVLEPVPFLKRLTALMSRPYVNNVRYHGVFCNRSKDRARLPPPFPDARLFPSSAQNPPSDDDALPAVPLPPMPLIPALPKRRRSSWAQLLKRTLHLDALKCPKCSESMEVLALITDPAVVRKILDHLHLPADDPPRAPARIPEPEPFELEPEPEPELDDEPGRETDDPFPSFPTHKRGPPWEPD